MFNHRVKFYTQEIVFFRQDQLYNMRRSCLLPPSETETVDPFQHVIHLLSMFSALITVAFWFLEKLKFICCVFKLQLVATITHQSHLCPLPLTKQQPIIWNYDHSLHLYPTPHTVLLIPELFLFPFSYNTTMSFTVTIYSIWYLTYQYLEIIWVAVHDVMKVIQSCKYYKYYSLFFKTRTLEIIY